MTTDLVIALLGFAVGALLVFILWQIRAQRSAAAQGEQIRTAQDEAAARLQELETLHATNQTAIEELQATQDDLAYHRSRVAILEADLHEQQSAAGEVEDRLNAAEARALTAEALIEQNRSELTRWSVVYGEMRTSHVGLQEDYTLLQGRQQALEIELEARRAELDQLNSRLDELHAMQLSSSEVADGQRHEVEEAAASLAREDAQAALRRREMDLAEVQGHLSAMRFSLNVLTRAGAELAQRVMADQTIDYGAALSAPTLPRAQNERVSVAGVDDEEVEGLRSIIADWYAEMEPNLHFDPHLLLMFGGSAAGREAETRGSAQPLIGDGAGRSADAVEGTIALASGSRRASATTEAIAHTVELPPSLMLAAIKAAASSALDRNRRQQLDLVQSLALSEQRLAELTQGISAWRSMLYATMATDPSVRQLLDENQDAPPGEMLAACATVALSAYQRKTEALARTPDAEPPPGTTPLQAPRTALTRATELSRQVLRALPARR